jgi:hypothetical protein
MSNLLSKVLREHEEEVLNMGYDSVNDIGIHSIWKGARGRRRTLRHYLVVHLLL